MSGSAMPDYSKLPSMTALLEAAAADHHLREVPRGPLAEALREAVDDIRDRLRRGAILFDPRVTVSQILQSARDCITKHRATRLTRVINATGVILHTGLGRSALAAGAVRRLADVAAGYCSLEIDLATGQRGQRGLYAEHLLCQLTGAEAAMIVNNNAAATMLALRGMAAGREVIVSRGQLIEIGGSYRLPDVMVAGGAVLREVGTTNKTHLRDYEAAISDRTAMIMHVHTSNYRVVGFAESPGVAELAELAHAKNLVMFDDLGSGALLDDEIWRAAKEPTVIESLRTGADFVALSGDKLLGGPQAGILLGRRETIDRLRKDPMARALRVDKLTLAALEATLELYQDPARAKAEIPILAALSEPMDSLTRRAEELATALRKAMPHETFTVSNDESFAGGGSLPAWPLPTAVVRWKPTGDKSVDEIARSLRLSDPAVLIRIHESAICLDLRSVSNQEAHELVTALINSIQ